MVRIREKQQEGNKQTEKPGVPLAARSPAPHRRHHHP